MARKIKALKGGKLSLQDEVEEIYEKKITRYGNGAKIDSQKKYIGQKAFVIILKKE